MGSKVKVADNSGAKLAKCFKVLGGSGKMTAYVGDIIMVSIIDAVPNSLKAKKGDTSRAVVVRTRQGLRRQDGSYIKFDDNAIALLDKQDALVATRVFGFMPIELRAKFMKIISLAPGVL